MKLTQTLASAALQVARELRVDAILVSSETGRTYWMIKNMSKGLKVIAATVNRETYRKLRSKNLPAVLMPKGTRIPQLQHAIAKAVGEKMLVPGNTVLCLIGKQPGTEADTVFVHRVNGSELSGLAALGPVVEAVIELSIKLAREGMDGKPVGTSFTIGSARKVLGLSSQIGINPFKGYRVSVTDRRSWYLIRRYALACEGTFVLRSDGLILGADRYIRGDHVRVSLPNGLGTRHRAIARATKITNSVGVVVSESDRQIRVFRGGRIVATIDPLGKVSSES